MQTKAIQASIIVLCCSALFACGGGGSSEIERVVASDGGSTTGDSQSPTGDSTSGEDNTSGGNGDDQAADSPTLVDNPTAGSGDDVIATPTIPGGDPTTVVEEDVVTSDDLLIPAEQKLEPTQELVFEVDLGTTYAGARAMLCITDEVIGSAVAVDFNACVFSGKLSTTGTLVTDVFALANTEFLVGVVIGTLVSPEIRNWQNVNVGQTLLIN